jgi:hypothetical protein
MEFAVTVREGRSRELITPAVEELMPQDISLDRNSSPIPQPCPVCQTIARATIRAAQLFGSRIAREDAVAEFICAKHLPIIVGLTAPRELAKWLFLALEEAARIDTPVPAGEPCALCEAAKEVQDDAAPPTTGVVFCREHTRAGATGLQLVLPYLDRIAAGGHLSPDVERAALRSALVLYASVRGTTAFIPSIG